MFDTPAVTPITLPVPEPIVIALPPVLHTPPFTPSASAVVAPMHTLPAPVIAVGVAFTVTVFVAAQPATI